MTSWILYDKIHKENSNDANAVTLPQLPHKRTWAVILTEHTYAQENVTAEPIARIYKCNKKHLGTIASSKCKILSPCTAIFSYLVTAIEEAAICFSPWQSTRHALTRRLPKRDEVDKRENISFIERVKFQKELTWRRFGQSANLENLGSDTELIVRLKYVS